MNHRECLTSVATSSVVECSQVKSARWNVLRKLVRIGIFIFDITKVFPISLPCQVCLKIFNNCLRFHVKIVNSIY